MLRTAIYGAGGLGREVRGMLEMQRDRYSFVGFIDDFKTVEQALSDNDFDDVVVSIADPVIRRAIISNWSRKAVAFENVIAREVALHPSVKSGKGAIICAGVKATVAISIGDFVIINLNATIGHDVRIGDFCSIMPSANISGNVELGTGVFVGSGATILQNITIGENAIIGAASLITHDVPANSTVVGVPGRVVRKNSV